MIGVSVRTEEDENNENVNEEDCKDEKDNGEYFFVVPGVGEGVEGEVTDTTEDAGPMTVSELVGPEYSGSWVRSGVRDGLIQDIEHHHAGPLAGTSAWLFRINPIKLLALHTAGGLLHALTGTLKC